MASIRDFAVTIFTATTTANMVCEMPEHVAGDLLVAFVNKDTASLFTTPSTAVGTPVSSSNWTAVQTQVSAGAGGGVYAIRAASSSENVTFPLSAESCCGVVISVKDAYGTTVADAIPTSAKSGADDSTLPLAGIGLTTAHANSLLLHGLSTDSGIGANALPPWINIFAGDAGANSLCVSYSCKAATGAVTAPDHWGGAADDSRGFMVAVRPDASATSLDAYMPLGATVPARQISPLNGSAGVVDKGAWTAAASTTITTINGRAVTGVTASTAVTDSGINPFRSSALLGGASTVNLAHTEFVLTATDNLTQLGGMLFATWQNTLPRDYVDSGKASQAGKYLVVGNDASNYKCWVIGGQFSKTELVEARNQFLIELSTSDTIYGSAVGSPNYATADFFAFGTCGYYGAVSMRWNEMYLIGTANLAGGTPANPIDLDGIVFAINNGCGILPLMRKTGSAVQHWMPLTFGGVEPIHIACNLNTFMTPQKADETRYVDCHVSSTALPVTFDGRDRGGGDVDTLHFPNCTFSSPSTQPWGFAATHAAGADINFTGASVVNKSVTLQSTSPQDRVTFIDCPSFIQNGAALTNCTFQNTKVTSADLAAMDNISTCSFTSGGTGYAIEVSGSASTITFTGNTFTGYAASNGSTGNEAIFVNIAAGTVTLNISGGSTPSIRTAGATVVVNNNVTVTLTGLKNPTEVRVFDQGTTTERGGTGAENVTTGSHAFSLPASLAVDISILSLGYQNMRILNYSTAASTSVPISQVLDRQFYNPA